jgi:flagellar protein FlaG
MANQVSNIPVQQQSQDRLGITLNNAKEVNEESKTSKESLEKVVNGLNKFLEPTYTNVNFKIHERTHSYYIQIVDTATNEVIREIPPKKMLDIYADLMTHIGLLVDKKI